MSKFNTVIKNYINEQMLSVNPSALPKKFTGLNTNTENLSKILVGLSSELTNSGTIKPDESIELQKFLNPEDTTYSDAGSFLENPKNQNLKKIFIDKGLYIPTKQVPTAEDGNQQITINTNKQTTSTPTAKAPEGSAYSGAPKA